MVLPRSLNQTKPSRPTASPSFSIPFPAPISTLLRVPHEDPSKSRAFSADARDSGGEYILVFVEENLGLCFGLVTVIIFMLGVGIRSFGPDLVPHGGSTTHSGAPMGRVGGGGVGSNQKLHK
jgi:hypothetical protein